MKFAVLDLEKDIQKYREYFAECINVTVYHQPEYLLAELKAEEGETKIFLYEDGSGFALFPSVIKKINDIVYLTDVLDTVIYDMITPHEYSGIIANNENDDLKERLLREIIQYCEKNNIIFGFVRINPYFREQPQIFKARGFQVILSNRQVYVDLKQTAENIWNAYRSNVKRNIKRAQKEDLTFEIAQKNDKNIRIFQKMYVNAMDILEARRFLYFNSTYFDSLIMCGCVELCFVRDPSGKVIASGIMLVEDNMTYYHLGCFDRDYSTKRPMNYLIHSMILWAKSHGCSVFHLGGGGSSLMQFKEGYSQDRIDYYIAYGIYDESEYDDICRIWRTKFPEADVKGYYPQYRSND